MISYKKRDKARDLYNQGWQLSELEVKFGCKMTCAWIPSWMRDLRNKKEIERQKREERNRRQSKKMLDHYYRNKSLAEKERAKKLKKSEIKKIKSMINKIAPVNAFNQGRSNIKNCIINNYLSRKW